MSCGHPGTGVGRRDGIAALHQRPCPAAYIHSGVRVRRINLTLSNGSVSLAASIPTVIPAVRAQRDGGWREQSALTRCKALR